MINDLPTSSKRLLKSQGITSLNDMQLASLAAHESHGNILLLSPTGSGKTLAFLLPLLSKLDPKNQNIQAMIIAPTRELAIQIEDVYRSLKMGSRVLCCYGGHSMREERKNLEKFPQLIIGTPGRIDDHMKRENISTDYIKSLVIDEFDKSLAYGFQKEMKSIFKKLPNLESITLTSATYAEEIPSFLKFKNHEVLNFLDDGKSQLQLDIHLVVSEYKDKLQKLFDLLCFLQKGSSIIFCNHRESVERLHGFLSEKNIETAYYHGKLEQSERESTLTKFRNGSVQILIATDLAARGVDIEGIDHIIHYHLPQDRETYTHRNGRTARMKSEGKVYLLISKSEELPSYLTEDIPELKIEKNIAVPTAPLWVTLYIAAGRKEKINKVDIVGFLSKVGELSKNEIGQISLKDHFAYVAVKRNTSKALLKKVEGKKIKNKKVKIKLAD